MLVDPYLISFLFFFCQLNNVDEIAEAMARLNNDDAQHQLEEDPANRAERDQLREELHEIVFQQFNQIGERRNLTLPLQKCFDPCHVIQNKSPGSIVPTTPAAKGQTPSVAAATDFPSLTTPL